jgi:hypothetical protein
LFNQSHIGKEGMYNSLFDRVLTRLRIQTTKGEAELLLELGKHADEV